MDTVSQAVIIQAHSAAAQQAYSFMLAVNFKPLLQILLKLGRSMPTMVAILTFRVLQQLSA